MNYELLVQNDTNTIWGAIIGSLSSRRATEHFYFRLFLCFESLYILKCIILLGNIYYYLAITQQRLCTRMFFSKLFQISCKKASSTTNCTLQLASSCLLREMTTLRSSRSFSEGRFSSWAWSSVSRVTVRVNAAALSV